MTRVLRAVAWWLDRVSMRLELKAQDLESNGRPVDKEVIW
jgi:hypothetical protein